MTNCVLSLSSAPKERRCSDGFLDEQRRSFGALDNESTQFVIGAAHQAFHQLVGRLGFERVEINGCEEGLAIPFMLVIRSTRQKHEQAGSLDTFDQTVEYAPRLDVGPLDVFEPEQQRLAFRAAKKQVLQRRAHPSLALRGIERRPIRIL